MSPKRCLAVKKRGVLKEPLKNITPKLSLRQLSAVLRGCTDDGPKIEQLRQELRERLQSIWLQLCGWGAGEALIKLNFMCFMHHHIANRGIHIAISNEEPVEDSLCFKRSSIFASTSCGC